MAITSLATFVELLADSRLLTPAQQDELARELASQYDDPKALARCLLERGWLTPYQVNQLFQGRSQHLVLAPYVLLERLGEGGMGQVFKARHQVMNRVVALKVIRKECLAHPDAVRRFHREIQTAAQLAHPNVVHAYDANSVGDTHFFVMEYVEGTDLNKVVHQRGPLPVAEACEYVRQAALGLQHAHECGMVHRDIKPGNLLLAKAHGTKGRGLGVVKVLDMGLARLTQGSETEGPAFNLTQEGSVMGTPDYIAPEQAQESHTVDIRADVYSLGCTLFFLLTGQVPFPGGSLMQKLMKHQQSEPTPIESIRADLPPGLGEVVRKLMAKRPDDRYQTPGEVAAALEPFARGEGPPVAVPFAEAQTVPDGIATPVATPAVAQGMQATLPATTPGVPTQPDSTLLPRPVARPWYEWVVVEGKKRPLVVAAGGGAAVLLLGLVLFLLMRPGKPPEEKKPPPPRPPDPLELLAVLGGDRGRHWGPVRCLAVSPDGKLIASGGDDFLVCLWKAETLELVRTLAGHKAAVTRLAFSPDGKQLASGGDDNLVLFWNVASGKAEGQAVTTNGVRGLTYAPGGDSIFTGVVNGPVIQYDVIGKQKRDTFTLPGNTGAGPVAFTADDKRVLAGCSDGQVRFWNLAAPDREVVAFAAHPGGWVQCLALAPDGKRLATGGQDGWLRVWPVKRPDPMKPLAAVEAHKGNGGVASLVFSSDGKSLLTTGADGTAKVWDASSLKPRQTFAAHRGGPVGAAVFAGGDHAVSAGSDGLVRRWHLETAKEDPPVVGHAGPVGALALSLDGKQVLSGAADGSVLLWDLNGREPTRFTIHSRQPTGHTSEVWAVAISSDGSRFLSAGRDLKLIEWDRAKGKPVRTPYELPNNVGNVIGLTFAGDGHRVLFGNGGPKLVFFDLDNGNLGNAPIEHFGIISCVVVSPDGKRVLSGGSDWQLRQWDLGTWQDIGHFAGHTDGVLVATYLKESDRALSVAADRSVWRWDLKAGKGGAPLVPELAGWDFKPSVQSAGLSPDGRFLAVAGNNGRPGDSKVIVWELPAGKHIGKPLTFPGIVSRIALTADRKMALAGSDGTVRLYKINPPAAETK